eukprot:m.387760 g.387760  ORF g.387760 m.387760 type:complete len:354 (+) comp21036_c0_seq5:234-1295(+)
MSSVSYSWSFCMSILAVCMSVSRIPAEPLVPSRGTESLPILFLGPQDAHHAWGLIKSVANRMTNLSGLCTGCNLPGAERHAIYERFLGGITPLALLEKSSTSEKLYELFFYSKANSSVWCSNTADFTTYSAPIEILPSPGCLPKTITHDRAGSKYILLCQKESSIGAFTALAPLSQNSMRPVNQQPEGFVFHDHDDQQLIFDPVANLWVDVQITFETWTTRDWNGTGLKYCDNAGCSMRRIVSTRTSPDGSTWTNNSACDMVFQGQLNNCTVGYNASGMISPDLSDPPELEFYKLTPSTLGGGSNRVVGHALLYSPAPMESLGGARLVLPISRMQPQCPFDLLHGRKILACIF